MNQERASWSGEWQTVFTGNLFTVEQNDRGWEKAVRAPGVRLILDDQKAGKILLTREFRRELGDYDYRLPGGKVFDSLAELQAYTESRQDIIEAAVKKAIQEAREETGYKIIDPELVAKSTLGATVEWDLYVFAVTNFQRHEEGQALEEGEDIETDRWFTYQEAREMILSGKMQEERIALALLRYLYAKEVN
ncbi:MAG: NUDIX domain-containing protein [Candidatus Saccharibacteria bacterium]|nr:NUDIX domain-containing protein [Candidatus Saccharibacteria bacterium]